MTELEIKLLLVKYFLEHYDNFVVGSEYSFQFGERRADLALLNSRELTAFEIKGARDKLSRLDYQIESYKNVFDYCFVVCESSNLSEIRSSIPKEIGILLADGNQIKHIRTSKHFKRHDKVALASALNLTKLNELSNKKIRSKHALCQHIADKYSIKFLRELSRLDFKERYELVTKLMRQETSVNLNPDDIHTITKKGPTALKRRNTLQP